MENTQSTNEPVSNSVVEVTESNIDSLIADSELLLIIFYSTTTSSTRMVSIFDEVAKKITEEGLTSKVTLAKIDCIKEDNIARRYQIYGCYPIILQYRYGVRMRNVCRSKRTVQGFVEFIKEHLSDPIIEINSLNELNNLSEDKGHIVAYINNKDQPEYDILYKVATALRYQCEFYMIFRDNTAQLSEVFRSTGGTTVEMDDKYNGSMLNFRDVYTWVEQRAYHVLREMTSENEETLKKRPYYTCVILLHLPSDIKSVKIYKEAVRKQLSSDEYFNPLLGDGRQFNDLLDRFRKSISDLPIIVIVSCSYVWIFDFSIVTEPLSFKKSIDIAKNGPINEKCIYVGRLTDLDTEDTDRIFELFE